MRRLWTRFARRLSSCSCILLLLATQLPAAQAQDDLVARARQEGSVTLYGAMVADQANAVAERFKARYGITMNVLRIGADQIPTRVITEQRGGLNNVDLIAMPALQTGLLKRLGLLASYAPPENRELLAGVTDPDGTWTTYCIKTEVIAYNPVRLRTLGIKPPVTWEDLARPEWRGQFGLASNDIEWDVALRRFYGAARKDQLMRALAANQPRMLESHTLGLTLVASGELLAMAAAYGPDAYIAREKGAAVTFVNPTPTVMELDALSIVKTAPHPNAARLFERWILSRETQEWFSGAYISPSARKDVKSRSGLLDPHARYVATDPADSVDYNADVGAFRRMFNIPG
jgi:iron(III) transport system substrate-binding protein